jgi:protein-tyrosine phosphatase
MSFPMHTSPVRYARPTLDADEILSGLWQGAEPPQGEHLARAGFKVLVLAAQEHQPRSKSFPGLLVVHAPLDDSGPPPTGDELRIATSAARVVAKQLRDGHKTIVTCHMGINRSGLISALALHFHLGISGADALARVRQRRFGALTNRFFSQYLSPLPARR